MSEVQEAGFGIFPPETEVEIDGCIFVREPPTMASGGRIAVFADDHETPIGRMPPGFTTRDAALAWLSGYRAGRKEGERRGRFDLQCEMRALLGIR